MNEKNRSIKASDSFLAIAKKNKAIVARKKQIQNEKVVAYFSPDGGKTIYPFSSKKKAKERTPLLERRYENRAKY